jgi:heptosyltransferase-2
MVNGQLSMVRVLVIKLADIGDVLTATPALRAIRESYPGASIDLLTTPRAAAAVPHQLVDTIHEIPRNLVRRPADIGALLQLLYALRQKTYDAVLILHHLTLWPGVMKYRLLAAATGAPVVVGLDNGKGGWLTHSVPDGGFGTFHEVVTWLRVAAQIGATTDDERLAVRLEEVDLAGADWLLRDVPAQNRVVIHPGSGGYSLARRWDAHKWARLADDLVGHYGAHVVLVGTAADGVRAVLESMTAPAWDLAGQTSLPQLAGVIHRCQLFLGADSGIMHLAVASGVPVVALFGPSNHRAWGPWTPQDQAYVVRLAPACSPCSYVGHSVGQREGCWHRSCMADLQPAKVLEAIDHLGVLSTL